MKIKFIYTFIGFNDTIYASLICSTQLVSNNTDLFSRSKVSNSVSYSVSVDKFSLFNFRGGSFGKLYSSDLKVSSSSLLLIKYVLDIILCRINV